MRKELPKVYEPQQVESEIYKMWAIEKSILVVLEDILIVPVLV